MGQLRVVMRTWSRKSRKVRHRFAASTIQICGRRVTRRAREWKAWIPKQTWLAWLRVGSAKLPTDPDTQLPPVPAELAGYCNAPMDHVFDAAGYVSLRGRVPHTRLSLCSTPDGPGL